MPRSGSPRRSGARAAGESPVRAVGQRRARPRGRVRACTRRTWTAARWRCCELALLARAPLAIRDLSGCSPAPSACSAPPTTCSACAPSAADNGRGCATRLARRRASAARDCRWPRAVGDTRRPLPLRPASPATACTRFRSARCMPASSSPATSASRWWARRCCGSKQRLGYVHKGIEKRFEELDAGRGPAAGGARQRRQRGRFLLGLLHGAREGCAAWSRRRGRCLCARWRWSASARQPPGRSGRARQRRRLRLRPQPVRAPQGVPAAHQCRRSTATATPWTESCRAASRTIWRRRMPTHVLAQCDALAARAQPAARAIYADHAGRAGSLRRRRSCSTPELAARLGVLRARRPRQRAGVRPALRLPGAALRPARGAQGAARRGRRGGAGGGALRRSAGVAAPVPQLLRETCRAARPASSCRRCRERALRLGLVEGWRGPVLVALETAAGRPHRAAATRTIPRGTTGRRSNTR